MWRKKISNNQRGAPQSSTLLQGTPYGATVFAGGGGSDSYQPRGPPERSNPPPRPPPADVKRKGLPSQSATSASQPPPALESKFRPVSSIYSQPSSPHANSAQFSQGAHQYAYPDVEVSPPSSPEFGRSQIQPGDDDVSPIDATPDASSIRFAKVSNTQDSHTRTTSGGATSRKPAPSSIPQLRKEKRRNQVAAAAANLVQRKQVGDAPQGRQTSDVRWDPYSGEITTSNRGKPQSVKPGEFTPPGARSSQGSSVQGNQTSISGPMKPGMSFGERVRKLKPLNTPVERPEWKGATGRAAIVSPVTDQPEMEPLSIPRKSSKRVASPIVSATNTPISAIRTTSIDETGPVSSQPVDPTIRAVPTRSGDNSPKGGALLSPSPEPAPTAAAASSAIKLTLDTSSPAAPAHQKKDSVDTIERNFREALQRTFNPDPAEPYVQPPSRFSVTTYATSAGDTGSPRPSTDSNRPPMPTPPRNYSNSQEPPTPTPATPILNRKRPKIGDSKSSSRKSAPSSPVLISMTSSIATKRPTNKSLPKPPPEAGSQDLISSLQAQLDDLSNRRNNIMKRIKLMTELMPTDHVVETAEVRRKREEEKHLIEDLKEEEADIRRQEHDLGLKLHRAWKRKDNDAAYESTGLWVKRVTG